MSDDINNRKQEHLRAFEIDKGIERDASGFDSIHLTHRALPEIDFADIDPSIEFLGKRLSFPFLVSSMTGGSSKDIVAINRNLAIAAEACQVAMAVGSQRVMFKDDHASNSFALRQFAPNTVLLSNIGAVQLNTGFTVDHFQQAIDVLGADGLYLHLNPLQEAIQPEGDRNFSGLANKIKALVEHLNVPVLLKEVGAGLSPADIALGLDAGIRYFDVAGRGGTSWSRIEYHRREREDDINGLVFQDWGLTTVQALKLSRRYLQSQPSEAMLIASGGMRTGLDMAKAVVLGAGLCGFAAPLLQAAQDSSDAVIDVIENIKQQYMIALFLLGCQSTQDAIGNTALLAPQE